MIFLTVGTQFPFDRLVKMVDEACDRHLIEEEIFAQIGKSSYQPRNFQFVNTLDRICFDRYVQGASSIISHAGMGVITSALDNQKPLLAMPRLREHSEVVNNHQVDIAKKFEQLGHILVLYKQEELTRKLTALKSFTPTPRTSQLKPLADKLTNFLKTLSENQRQF